MKELLKLVTPDQQKQLLELLINGPDFVSLSSITGDVTFVNDAGKTLMGIDKGENIRRHNSEYIMPSELERLQKEVNPTLFKEGRWTGKIDFRHFKTGLAIPFHATTMLIYDAPSTEPAGRVTIARDLREEVKSLTQQQKLATLVNNSKDLMSLLTTNGTNEYINESGKKLLGIEDEPDVTAIHISSFHTPEQLDFVEKELLPAVMNNGQWSGQFHIKHYKTGEIIPLENNCIRIDDPYNGEPVAIGAVMRDLRPELAVQEAIRQGEQMFKEVIMHAPVAIGLLEGPQLIITAANSFMFELWGKQEDIKGLPLMEALPELEGQGFIELLMEVRSTGKTHYGNETLAKLHRKGVLEDSYFNFAYARVENDPDKLIVVAAEITQQVLAKKAMEESQKRFSNLILDAPMATALYRGKELIIEIANTAMLQLWGKDASVIGRPLKDAIPELEGQPFIPRLEDVLKTGIAYHTDQEKADLVVNGRLQRFWFNYTYKPLYNTDGSIYGILNMAVDVSHQVRLQHIKDEFIALASHELKTPITTIKGYTQLLASQLDDSRQSPALKMLHKMNQQVDRLTHLIGEMLDVTQIQAGKIPFNPKSFDLSLLVRELTEDTRLITQTHTLVFNDMEVLNVFADRDRIGQVISNLLGNAIKYSPDAQEVIISASSSVGYALVTVRDFGIGISDANRAKIFEQFYRVNEGQTKTFPGLGLGLYISSQIIKQEDGDIWVQPVEGPGSLFCFKIPLKTPE